MQKSRKRKSAPEPMEVDERPVENAETAMDQDQEENGDADHISDDEEGGTRVGDIYIPPAAKPALTFDATGPRLLITHIINKNFKSYAGEQVLGPFHKSFTAIIGPNGSGKSNVIDSMLFVFGYRASKIRSKKISLLVHSSSKHPNADSATVSVHFCKIIDGDGEDFEVVPNSEIVVARTAFRDSSSYYTLNGRRVQFKEVAKMLRAQGIDLDHNRFLILQGEVEQIAMMKPKGTSEHDAGMLEYLEDIIGTSRYKEPIEKLLVRTDELTDLRKEKLNRVKVVEQDKLKLEQPMREAVELMILTNVWVRTKNTLLQKYIHEANKMIVVKEKELEELKTSLAAVDEKLDAIMQQLQEKTTVLKEGTQKYDVLRKQKEEIAEKLQTCRSKTVEVHSDTTQSNTRKKNLQKLLERDRSTLINLELIPEKNEREIKDCEKLMAKHEENLVKAVKVRDEAVASVRSKTESLKEQKDRLQAKLIRLEEPVDELTKKYNLAKSNLKIYSRTETVEKDKLDTLQEDFRKATTELEEKQNEQSELEVSVPEKEIQLRDIQTKLKDLKKEEHTVSNEAKSLRGQLETTRQAMSANKSRGRVLDALMKEKTRNLPGIFGRLGDLGGIDAKYDVAISTCCPALDNIVVDTVDTAQACVEYLKRHDIGRATFIVLEKQEHLKQHYQIPRQFPENVARLFDMVRVLDERIKPAFYFALRDTLVAAELEQASRIAYGQTRYRMVTLKGDVIEIAGTMSGGGKSVMRGRMSSSVQQVTSDQDPAALQANERRLEQLDRRLLEIRSSLSALEDEAASLQRAVRDGKATLHKLNVELHSLREQVPVLENQMKQQELKVKSTKVDARQLAKMEADLQADAEKLEKARLEAGEVQKEVDGVDAQITAILGGKVKDTQKAVDELTKKINKVKAEVIKLNLAIKTSHRKATSTKANINQMETDLNECEATLENLGQQSRQLALETAAHTQLIEQLEEQISEGTSEFDGLKKEINKLHTKENKVKEERISVSDAVTKMEQSVQDIRSKPPIWEREIKALVLEDPGVDGVEGVERPEPLVTYTAEELEEASVEELRNRLQAQKARLGAAKPNLQAILDYRAKDEQYLRRAEELEAITERRNHMRALHDDLRKRRTTEFMAGFNTITAKLKEMYQMITLGGDAELELADSMDPFTDGVEFSVRPPNKTWKRISNLSGGEKTLSSLALVFALHYYRPTPLYVMDEIDAALDFKNVSIVANYIKERTKNAQFIIISLRYNMFEVSHRLVGIYKTEDCTKSVTIENKMPEKQRTEPMQCTENQIEPGRGRESRIEPEQGREYRIEPTHGKENRMEPNQGNENRTEPTQDSENQAEPTQQSSET